MKYLVLIIVFSTILLSLSCEHNKGSNDYQWPTVEITNPQDNDEFIYGTVINITADAYDETELKKVEFDISISDPYVEIANYIDQNEPYEFEWDTGDLKGQLYTIRARAYDAEHISYASIKIILKDSDSINIIVPNGGENWQTGDLKTIIWEDNIHSNVMIELFESDSFYSTIINSTPNDSLFDYIVPNDILQSSYYTIKITSTYDDSIYDFSDDYFTISQINDSTVTDIDGNVYQTVVIGTQEWMMENLKVTHFNNGDEIPHITSNSEWTNLSSGAFCYFNNDTTYIDTFGNLYNWHALNDSRGLAPAGWHIPTDVDWGILIAYLDGEAVAGGKMKATGTIEDGDGLWNAPNAGATNESGFSALPAGYRSYYGNFGGNGNYAFFWSSDEYTYTYARELLYNSQIINSQIQDKRNGFSIRCLKD